jgi:addiction module HigA family antidote
MKSKKLSPVHPGAILDTEFIKPMHLSQNRLALALRVPARRINEIVLGKRSITADTALRLSRYFNNSARFWLGLQMEYDLDVATDKLEDRLEREIQPCIIDFDSSYGNDPEKRELSANPLLVAESRPELSIKDNGRRKR